MKKTTNKDDNNDKCHKKIKIKSQPIINLIIVINAILEEEPHAIICNNSMTFIHTICVCPKMKMNPCSNEINDNFD